MGIWWTIGLASPLATGFLIRTFVFGWAIEWVFFIIEIVAAFLFYYRWDKLPPKTHVIIGWIYAGAAWISLVLITGITAFMLHPGMWLERKSFWVAFFNPQFLPQTIARTGGALLLSSLYVYLHASFVTRDRGQHRLIESRSTRPAMLGALLILAGGIGWFILLPESARAVISSAAVLNILVVLLFALTVAVFILLFLGPYQNPGWMTPGFAAALMMFGLAAFSTGEFIREAVRKPYVVYNVVLANQIYPDEVPGLQENGFLDGGIWTKALVEDQYPLLVAADGNIDERRMSGMDKDDRIALGGVIFQYHCNDCHAIKDGYSAVGPLVRGWTPDMLKSMTMRLNEHHFFMPQWAGTEQEAELVAEYLASVAPPRPRGMLLHENDEADTPEEDN